MSIVRVNAMNIPEGQGDAFLERFAARPQKIEHLDGFEGFQVLRPSDGRTTWLVVTQWRDEAAFAAWHDARPHRDPKTTTYADGWELWHYDVIETVLPAT